MDRLAVFAKAVWRWTGRVSTVMWLWSLGGASLLTAVLTVVFDLPWTEIALFVPAALLLSVAAARTWGPFAARGNEIGLSGDLRLKVIRGTEDAQGPEESSPFPPGTQPNPGAPGITPNAERLVESRSNQLCEALGEQLRLGEQLLQRVPPTGSLITSAAAMQGYPFTSEDDVEWWEQDVRNLLHTSHPRMEARFMFQIPEPTTTLMVAAMRSELHRRLEHRLPMLEKVIRSLCR